jgi:hypothetical protein
MLEQRTHFEQIPLEIVRMIVEEQIRRETAAEEAQTTKKQTLKEDLLGTQEQSFAKSRTIPHAEVQKQS